MYSQYLADYLDWKLLIGDYPSWKENERQNTVAICPNADYPPENNPEWAAGTPYDPVGNYLGTTYVPTCAAYRQTEITGSTWGGWIYSWKNADESGICTKRKKLIQIIPNSVIMTENPWRRINSSRAVPAPYSTLDYASSKYHDDIANDSYSMGPAWRHSLSTNCLFQDGHVDNFKLNRCRFDNEFRPY
jgi:prepilin-type processing-associated H-X9-DG protein